MKDLPIVLPHGHTDPRWFAENQPVSDPARLFVTPDHYVFRMLHSQGVPLEAMGVPRADGAPTETDGRKIWRVFAQNHHLFRGTPSRLWLDHAFSTAAFRGQMLTEMARMSLDDGLVLQIHPGAFRTHSGPVLVRFGRDKGFDISPPPHRLCPRSAAASVGGGA